MLLSKNKANKKTPNNREKDTYQFTDMPIIFLLLNSKNSEKLINSVLPNLDTVPRHNQSLTDMLNSSCL